MKHLLLVTGSLTVTFVLLYVGSAVFKDRETFVPSPESVTQQFFKMLETRRFSVATKYLSDRLHQNISEKQLKAFDHHLRARTGEYQVYGGAARYTGGSTAEANVRIKGESVELWPVVSLRQEKGEWKIDHVDHPAGPEYSALFSISDVSLYGIEFALQTIYRDENRISFVFLTGANPGLEGLTVQVESKKQCSGRNCKD